MENEKRNRRIAVLIDADNVSVKYIQNIMDEISIHGTPTYKRIYGDWTKPQHSAWKSTLLNYSITPIQQYNYTTGKNSTDASLIIDAMDILYSGNVEGFCIVSSDSDFTRLASRLREAGMTVIGMGEKKTPAPFIAACDQFKYLEVLNLGIGDDHEAADGHIDGGADTKKEKTAPVKNTRKLVSVLKTIISELSDEEGWAYLGTVGNMLTRRLPDFDTRNYGFLKLSAMMDSLKQFDIEYRKTENGQQTLAYVRVHKPKKRKPKENEEPAIKN